MDNIEKIVQNEDVHILLSHSDINQKIITLGQEITRDYEGKDIVLVGVLTGCFIFMADLCREINLDVEISFLQISSYGNEMQSSGKVTVKQELKSDIEGKHVIIVEDIVDSGHSLDFLLKYLAEKDPASVKTVALLNKPNAHKVDVSVDYIGFNISDEFVIGYGLDVAKKKRNLKNIYQVITE